MARVSARFTLNESPDLETDGFTLENGIFGYREFGAGSQTSFRMRWGVLKVFPLGVDNLPRAVEFYEKGLGFPRMESPPEVAFFTLNGTWLNLFI